MKPATALALLAAGAFLGAALSAVVPAGRAVPAAATESGPAAGTAPASPIVPAAPSQDGYAAVARAVMPAVVNISSLKLIPHLRVLAVPGRSVLPRLLRQQFPGLVVPREQREMSLGSGVFVDERGPSSPTITSSSRPRKFKVALSDGREIKARILGADQRTDLAVLRVEKDSLPHAAMGDSEKMEVGDVVLAVGNPFGLGETVTMGIINAIGRAAWAWPTTRTSSRPTRRSTRATPAVLW